ncbi:MAG: putative DNA binding domain-containing protein [Kiritimatiellae bacterium]|nr:putative DNA binding domain-containing protein [Kiritimatiellia bacterium]
MTTIELQNIVARHEMQCLELKESFNVESIETACAFANANGGYIVIGVDNNGLPSKQGLRIEALRDYENKISTATEPCVAVDVEKIAFQGRDVVVLKVMENPLKPVAYKGRCFLRKGSVNHQMTPTEIAECHLKSTGSSMDAVIVPGATKDDLDLEVVRRYMRKAAQEKRRDYSDHSSRPRNKLIAQAFYDMHIIEHYGSGVKRMRNECDKNGSPYPIWTSEKGEFCIRFPARTPESAEKLGIDLAKIGLDSAKSTLKNKESTLKSTLNPTDARIVELISGNPSVTISDLENSLGLSREGVRKALKRLKKANVICRVGPDKGGHWEVCR